MARTTETMAEKTWELLATNVTSGIIRKHLQSGAFSIWWTFRPTGDAVPPAESDGVKPEDLDSGDAQPLFEDRRYEEISNSVGIDIYGWAKNSNDDDTDTVKIIMDL